MYVSNADLYEEIKKSKEQGELTKKAWDMLILMVQNITSKKYYNDPELRKDCQQGACVDIQLYWKGFDEKKYTNPFGYYSSLITNGINKTFTKYRGKLKSSEIVSLDNNIHSL